MGDVLVTNKRRPILTLVEDTSPGVHDTCMSACDIYRYRGLGVEGHHDSCTDNLFQGVLRKPGASAMQYNDASLLKQSSLHLCSMQCLPASKEISDSISARAHFCCSYVLFAVPSAGRQEAVVLLTHQNATHQNRHAMPSYTWNVHLCAGLLFQHIQITKQHTSQ